MINIVWLTHTFFRYYKHIDVTSSAFLLVFLSLGCLSDLSYVVIGLLLIHVILALFIKYYSFRLSIDEQIFKDLIHQPIEHHSQYAQDIDQALNLLKLSASDAPIRDWQERCLATLKLIKIHFFLFSMQVLISFVVVIVFRSG